MATSSRISILRTAERLFAQAGIEAVSLRQIAAEAGQRNTSAVAYHFGSKEALVAAVYQWRMAVVNERRMKLLAPGGGAAGIAGYVRALVEPLAAGFPAADGADEGAAGEGGEVFYLRFLAEAQRYPEYDAEHVALGRPEAESIRELILGVARLTAHLGLPPEVFAQRMRLVAVMVITALADRERQLAAGAAAAIGIDVLIEAGAAVLAAPREKGSP